MLQIRLVLRDKELLASRASRIGDTCQELESPRIDKNYFYERTVRLRSARGIDLAEDCLRERRWEHFPEMLL